MNPRDEDLRKQKALEAARYYKARNRNLDATHIEAYRQGYEEGWRVLLYMIDLDELLNGKK